MRYHGRLCWIRKLSNCPGALTLTADIFQTNHFNIGSLMERGIRLIGNGQALVHLYWEKLVEDIRSGKLGPLQMVSHRISLEDLDKVYYKFAAHEDGLQKIFVETKHSFPKAAGSPELTRY